MHMSKPLAVYSVLKQINSAVKLMFEAQNGTNSFGNNAMNCWQEMNGNNNGGVSGHNHENILVSPDTTCMPLRYLDSVKSGSIYLQLQA